MAPAQLASSPTSADSSALPSHILIVDDEEDIGELVRDILEDEGYTVEVALNGEEANKKKQAHPPDLILLDIWMPDIDGISLLKTWREEGNLSPVIMMSGHGTLEHAIEATKLGAADFLEKPLTLAKLLLVVEKTLTQAKQRLTTASSLPLGPEGLDFNALFPEQKPSPFEPVGRSLLMANLKEDMARLASLKEGTLLLLGEAGLEMEGLASYLHELSPEKGGPFLEFNLSTIDEQVLSTLLFAPNGQLNPLLLEKGQTGIFYFKEVENASTQIQTLLTQFLNLLALARKNKEPAVKVLFTAESLLPHLVEMEEFSRELWYLLDEVTLEIPPLSQHAEDIPELITYYLHYFVEEKHLNYRHFPIAVQNRLRNYAWVGNHLELKNIIKKLLILGTHDEVTLEEVNALLERSHPLPAYHSAEETCPLSLELPLKEARESFERAYLMAQYERAEGNMANLAKLVGMERTNLYRKLKSLDIDPKTGK